MARANGCEGADVAWWWSVVLALAFAVAGLAARMLARSTTGGAGGWAARGDVAPVALEGGPVELAPCTRSTPASRPVDDPALALLAWLCALGWVTFSGTRRRRPWWDVHCAHVRELASAGARPQVLR